MNNVFIYCEIEDGVVADVSLELLTKGRTLAAKLGVDVEAIAIGTGIEGVVEKQIFPYGAKRIHLFDAPGLSPYTTLPHASIVCKLFKEEQPQICLMGATVIGRDLGPRVSSALTSGLTADCTALEIGEFEDKKNQKVYKDLLYQIRPAFGGSIVATIVNPDHRPQMATVRDGVMKKEILDPNFKGEVVKHDVSKYVSQADMVVSVIERQVAKAKNNLKNAPIIVLDEATAFMDPENEEKMNAALDEIIKDKTVLVIAHRLSTIKNADRICVMKEGRCIAADTHDRLLEDCGEYKKLWDASVAASTWKIKEA